MIDNLGHDFLNLKNEIVNFSHLFNEKHSVIEIAEKYGWESAIFYEVFVHKEYERGDFVGVKKDDVVVDLGGNIGFFTRYAHQKGASKILTIEPDRRYFELLKQNANGISTLIFAGIGERNERLSFLESSHLGGSVIKDNLMISPSNGIINSYDVNIISLDFLFELNIIDRIDFLKMDIEGSELAAFRGISDERLSSIRNIVVEYHNCYFNYDESIRESLIERMRSLGFSLFVLFCGGNQDLQLLYFWK